MRRIEVKHEPSTYLGRAWHTPYLDKPISVLARPRINQPLAPSYAHDRYEAKIKRSFVFTQVIGKGEKVKPVTYRRYNK